MEKNSTFATRYIKSLIIDVAFQAFERFIFQFIPGMIGTVIVSIIVAIIFLVEAIKEDPAHPPSTSKVLIVSSIGFIVTLLTRVGLNALEPQPIYSITTILPPPPTQIVYITTTPPPTLTPQIILVTPTITPSPTLPSPEFHQICADAPPSPFSVGKEGYICTPDKVLMRSKASQKAAVIGSIDSNTKFRVIGGPECGDQRIWWKIQLYYNDGYNGMRGWMPESDPGGTETYLCPLQP